jgi:hypothetical protein
VAARLRVRGRIDQQNLLDICSKVGFAKLYDINTAITAADLLNDRLLPVFYAHGILLCRMLTALAVSTDPRAALAVDNNNATLARSGAIPRRVGGCAHKVHAHV